ncbi:MAG: hypothetical protein PVG30_02195 [Gammaproteobacteria bacterium]|jgi:hypothetical protein
MSNFANWTETTFVNGTTPPINDTNLNKNEEALTNIMGELNYSNSINSYNMLDYAIENNVKEIHNFENHSDFGTSGTITASTVKYTDVLCGIGGVKMLENDNSSGVITIDDTIATIDLTVYPSGAAEGSDDKILLIVYISDHSYISSIKIRLGNNSSNYYYATWSTTASGWIMLHINKSAFDTTGSPSGWNSISYVYIDATTTANAQDEFIIVNKLCMIRDVSGITSSFIVNDGSGNYDESPWIGNDTYTLVYFDKKIGKKGFFYAWEEPTDMIEIMNDVNSFSFKCEMYSKIDTYGGSVIWYIDSSNYIRIDIHDDLKIYENVSGSGSYVATGSLSGSIETGDRMMLWIDKTPDNVIRARLEVDGMKPVYAEYAITLSAIESGDVGFTTGANNQYFFVTDFTISNNNMIPLITDGKSVPINVIKYYDETVVESTTTQNDDELFIKLPSNSLFEVQLVLIYSSSSDTPNLKTQWSVSGDYEVFHDGKVFIGASTNTAYMSDVSLYMNNYLLTSTVSIGALASGEMPYYERSIIKTGDSGCILQFKWSQSTSDETAIQVDKGSYIIAFKL